MDNILITYGELISRMQNYCALLENARMADSSEFIDEMTHSLPAIYLGFINLDEESLPETGAFDYLPQYLDEDTYNHIRQGIEAIMGQDDTYLETIAEDMKYSDTPIAQTISENLADIFQDLFNCATAIRESEGLQAPLALRICKENFNQYWSRTLCNVLRALNVLRTT